MIWTQRGHCFLSAPYQVIGSIRGWEAWIQLGGKYEVLAREIPTLPAAKKFCKEHQAKS
jgi:hypothetical protein